MGFIVEFIVEIVSDIAMLVFKKSIFERKKNKEEYAKERMKTTTADMTSLENYRQIKILQDNIIETNQNTGKQIEKLEKTISNLESKSESKTKTSVIVFDDFIM